MLGHLDCNQYYSQIIKSTQIKKLAKMYTSKMDKIVKTQTNLLVKIIYYVILRYMYYKSATAHLVDQSEWSASEGVHINTALDLLPILSGV